MTKQKYKSDAMESVHSSAKALFSIGSIDKDKMLAYDRLCLVPSTEVRGEKSKNKFHATEVGTHVSADANGLCVRNSLPHISTPTG